MFWLFTSLSDLIYIPFAFIDIDTARETERKRKTGNWR